MQAGEKLQTNSNQRSIFLGTGRKMDLFGLEMEDMEELRTKLETTGRDLPFGIGKAWYVTQI